MRFYFLFITSILYVCTSTSSCGGKRKAAHSRTSELRIGETLIVSDHVILEKRATRPLQETGDCRTHIESIMCLGETIDFADMPAPGENCIADANEYIGHFQTLYDAYPRQLQRLFCSLREIRVLNNFYGTAYAGSIVNDRDELTGARIGIRKSVLDEGLDLPTWASWKEQLSFGGERDHYAVSERLPTVMTQSQTTVNDFLYFVIAHEFAHILDFANGVNDPDPACEGWNCPYATTSYGNISWETRWIAKAEADFPDRDRLCFYKCENGTVPRPDIPQVYRDLHRSPFLSAYAATNAGDDFADTVAYTLMEVLLSTEYRVDTKFGATYDTMGKFRSPEFRDKRQYIFDFFGDHIDYP